MLVRTDEGEHGGKQCSGEERLRGGINKARDESGMGAFVPKQAKRSKEVGRDVEKVEGPALRRFEQTAALHVRAEELSSQIIRTSDDLLAKELQVSGIRTRCGAELRCKDFRGELLEVLSPVKLRRLCTIRHASE